MGLNSGEAWSVAASGPLLSRFNPDETAVVSYSSIPKQAATMAKCDIDIEFDQQDRTYYGGQSVTGTVHIQVNKDITCNGIVLTSYWRTHGYGNRDQGDKIRYDLVEATKLEAGQRLSVPFEIDASCWPLSYHGHHINLDHYVHVAVDVPWAIDPKQEEEYLLLPGTPPPEFDGARHEVIQIEKRAPTDTGTIAKICIAGAMLAMGFVLIPAAFIFVPIIIVFVGFVLGWQWLIASRVGKVELQVPHVVVGAGEEIPLGIRFTPKKTFRINEINAKLTAIESATSGSGTNSTTRRHTIHEERFVLLDAGMLQGGVEVNEEVMIPMPDSNAWSLSESDNKITWVLETRIDIPLFPDWKESTTLQFVPRKFVDDTIPSAELHEEVSGDDDYSAPPPPPAASVPVETAWQDDDYSEPTSAAYEQSADNGPIIALMDQILAANRFGNARESLTEQSAGRPFDLAIQVERVSRTFGYKGSSGDAYESGRTVTGTIAGTEHEVELFTRDESNDTVDELQSGSIWETQARVTSWDSLFNRLNLEELDG